MRATTGYPSPRRELKNETYRVRYFDKTVCRVSDYLKKIEVTKSPPKYMLIKTGCPNVVHANDKFRSQFMNY